MGARAGHGQPARLPGSLKHALAGDPALTVSRLLCPRRLDPLTEYLACVVPAFELGLQSRTWSADRRRRRTTTLKPAWTSGTQAPPPGDVAGLFPLGVSHRHGRRFRIAGATARSAQDCRRKSANGRWTSASPDLRSPAAATGHDARARRRAARHADAPPAEWPDGHRKRRFRPSSKRSSMRRGRRCNRTARDPLLAPPIYGCWQAARHTVNILPPAAANLAG